MVSNALSSASMPVVELVYEHECIVRLSAVYLRLDKAALAFHSR